MLSGNNLWLGTLIISISTGLITGCGSSPAKKKTTQAVTTGVQQREMVVTENEYVVRREAKSSPEQIAVALPLSGQRNAQIGQQRRQQQKSEQLRQQRHREWEQKQEQDAKRAEYHERWEQKQAAARTEASRLAASQAQQQKLAQQQRVQQQKAQQQQQAKRQQYHQQWQARQQQAQQVRQQAARTQQPQGYGGRGTGNYHATRLTGDFAGNSKLKAFIKAMVQMHGFNENYLYGVFSQTRNRDDVARLWARTSGGSSSGGKGWYNYRSKFVTPANTQKGVQFWQQYRPHLMRASRQYGVDPAYIVGIMGVETRWGRILGRHKVIDALTTSAIVNKRRSRFFFQELENYLLMTRSERMDPLQPKGSYAGAMGYGQFMPSSFRSFAVDFDGNGVRDLWNPVDAIGSIANYFAKHGWKNGQEVAVPAKVSNMAYTRMPDGYKVKYSTSRLAQKGIKPRSGRWSQTGRTHLLALTTVPGGIKEPWIGYHNFYVITRYNHSNYYAMAVHQLAKEVERKVKGGRYASR